MALALISEIVFGLQAACAGAARRVGYARVGLLLFLWLAIGISLRTRDHAVLIPFERIEPRQSGVEVTHNRTSMP